MNPLVSIIVPIYNMELYLARCLDSLLSQSLVEIEIIAINDGSTDRSLEILNQYAGKDARLRIIDQVNSGVAAARNAGIQCAEGAFIGFIDPDDWVDEHMYETLYQYAVREAADIAMCGYMREFGTHAKEKVFPLPAVTRYQHEEVRTKVMRRLIGPLDEELADMELLDAWGTVWSKLYRSELIKGNMLRFVDLSIVGTSEDTLFNIYASYYAHCFVFVNQPLYHYWRVNTSSITSKYKPTLQLQWQNLYVLIEQFLDQHRLGEEYYTALKYRKGLNTLGFGLNTISKSNEANASEKIQMIRLFLNDDAHQESFKCMNMKQLPFIWKTFYACAKKRYAFGLYIMLVVMEQLRRK